MLEVSKQLIQRIQAKNSDAIVKSIKITYLIESSNYDPWFIGTEYCQVLVRKKDNLESARKNLSKSVAYNMNGSTSSRMNSV